MPLSLSGGGGVEKISKDSNNFFQIIVNFSYCLSETVTICSYFSNFCITVTALFSLSVCKPITQKLHAFSFHFKDIIIKTIIIDPENMKQISSFIITFHRDPIIFWQHLALFFAHIISQMTQFSLALSQAVSRETTFPVILQLKRTLFLST